MAEEPVVMDAEVPGEPVAPAENGDAPVEEDKPSKTPEQYEEELSKVRREAHNLRTKLREAEPLAKRAQAADEAAKSTEQRAMERAQEAEKREAETLERYQRLELAVQYHIEHEDVDLIGSGSLEEMEARAQRVARLNAAASKANPPPTNQPVEGLRPGASPEPARPPDDSYPESWKPKWMRGDGESRITHGQ